MENWSIGDTGFCRCLEMEHTKEWEKKNCYHSSYKLFEESSNELLHDKLQFMFLELERFNKTESELADIYANRKGLEQGREKLARG